MVGWCSSCCCFRDVRRGTVAIGVFSMVTSVFQLLVTVAVFTGANQMSAIPFSPSSSMQSITYELYIALAAADFFMAVFALLLLYGNERSNVWRQRCYYWPWLLLLPFYVIYESGVNIYYFYNQFNQLYTTAPLSMGTPLGFNIVPLVYWVIKDFLLFISYTFILRHFGACNSLAAVPSASQSTDTLIQYVPQVLMESPYAPAPLPLALPPSTQPIYGPSTTTLCTNCGGGCPTGRCGGASGPGGAVMWGGGFKPTANVGRTGWTASIFQSGR